MCLLSCKDTWSYIFRTFTFQLVLGFCILLFLWLLRYIASNQKEQEAECLYVVEGSGGRRKVSLWGNLGMDNILFLRSIGKVYEGDFI